MTTDNINKSIDPVIAGAIFDFAGFLTTQKQAFMVGGTSTPLIIVELIKQWAELRGLSLQDPDVLQWQEQLNKNC